MIETQEVEKDRGGDYRTKAFSNYGKSCMVCGYTPSDPKYDGTLHVHHKEYSGNVEDMEVLCRSCHEERHNESEVGREMVKDIVGAVISQLDHKDKSHMKTVRWMVNSGLVHETDEAGVFMVEGKPTESRDEWYVDVNAHYLGMCSCYSAPYGSVRAGNMCTHSTAAVVASYIDEYADNKHVAIELASQHANKLNDGYINYTSMLDRIKDAVSRKNIYSKFGDNWAERTERQMKLMDGEGPFKCVGGECSGCEVGFYPNEGRYGLYKCDGPKNKFPCPGKLGSMAFRYMYKNAIECNVDGCHRMSYLEDDGRCWTCVVEQEGLAVCQNCDNANYYDPSINDKCSECRGADSILGI